MMIYYGDSWWRFALQNLDHANFSNEARVYSLNWLVNYWTKFAVCSALHLCTSREIMLPFSPVSRLMSKYKLTPVNSLAPPRSPSISRHWSFSHLALQWFRESPSPARGRKINLLLQLRAHLARKLKFFPLTQCREKIILMRRFVSLRRATSLKKKSRR